VLAERAWVAVLAGNLEGLLVDQVAAGRLEVQYLEATAADPGPGSLAQAGLPCVEGDRRNSGRAQRPQRNG